MSKALAPAPGRPPSPCMDCKRRKVGCHDVKKCKAWAEYVDKKKAAQAAAVERSMERFDETRHYKRLRQRKGDRP